MKQKSTTKDLPVEPAVRVLPKRAASNGNSVQESVAYGSYELSAEVRRIAQQSVQVPPIDREFIRAIAISRGHNGESECRDHHIDAFDARNVELLERCRRMDQRLNPEIVGAQRHIRDLTKIFDQTDRYRELNERTIPWTKFNIVQVVVLVLMSILLLAVGINSNATVLQSSGIAAFENTVRAYLFSLIPVGLAVAVKVPGSHIALRSRRLTYTYFVWALGLLFGFIWAIEFASIFPGLTQSTAELIDSLTNPASNTVEPHSNQSFVLVAMLAEVFLAAGCWLTIQFITEKHTPASRINNPAFLKVQADLDHWHKRQFENNDLSGALSGKIQAINNERAKFVSSAMASFHAAVKLAVNDKHLDDFLNR